MKLYFYDVLSNEKHEHEVRGITYKNGRLRYIFKDRKVPSISENSINSLYCLHISFKELKNVEISLIRRMM